MFDRRLATHFDWWFAAMILAMAFLGILTVYSANALIWLEAAVFQGANALAVSAFRRNLYLRQMTWVGIGMIALITACLVSYRTLARFAYVIFGLCLVSLILVLLIGKTGLGAHRWIRIGGFAFQPSEFAKLGLVLFLAR
jgi:rod shape determining protein RodA